MARPIRVEFEDAVYHVMARGNERRAIFRDDGDRDVWLKTLSETVDRFGVRMHAYCLMPNHYHLLLETPHANLTQAAGWLQVTYTIRFNRRHRRSGHLFQGRFKAQLVDADAYAVSLVRYLHLNPVRPRRRSDRLPSERFPEFSRYPWSSHQDYAGLRRPPDWLSLDWLRYWGATVTHARRAYQQDIRRAFGQLVTSPWVNLRGGLVLGSEALWQKVLTAVGHKPGQEEIRWFTHHDTAQRRHQLDELIRHEPDRQLQLWMSVVLGGQRYAHAAREFGYHYGSTALRIVTRINQQAKGNQELSRRLQSLRETFATA
ncbi:MAG TPA: transposase [Verrucomicrobiae bacterium]|nr:transposase [Verrucomicrobiae bacterium]